MFAVALAVASPLAANWVPVWNPTDLHLVVGQIVTVQVHVVFSGLDPYPLPIDQSFLSNDSSVAVAAATVQDLKTHNVEVFAVGPGSASIRSGQSPGQLGDWPWVRITVVCGLEAPVRPVAPVLSAQIGKPVVIAANFSSATRAVFQWYLGREGDRSHPLDAGGPSITFTPNAYGSQYLWVSVTTACSSSAAEVRVDVPQPRRRSASRGKPDRDLTRICVPCPRSTRSRRTA